MANLIVPPGNPELYDPTDMCRATVGRLTADSFTSGVARLSGKCWFSVGQVSVIRYACACA